MLSLGQKLRELRLKKGLTQVELSKGISTPSLLSQIESDRARPSYKTLSALADKLEVPLENLLVDVDMNLEFISTFKMAKAMVASGEYGSAIPLLIQILDQKRAVISEDDLRIELSECYMHTGQFAEAEKLLARVHENAVLRRDSYMIIRTYRNMGRIEFHFKRYELAAYQWSKALDEIERVEHQDIYLKAEILTDLGTANEQLGKVKEAIGFYSQASRLYDTTSNMDEIAKLYMGLGQSYRKLKDFKRAAEYSQQAISIYKALDNMYMSVKVQVLNAVSFAKDGREEEAIEMLEAAIHKLQELRKKEDVGIAYVEFAKVQISTGEYEKAKENCRVARSLLPELHLYQAWSNRILGEIDQQQGNHEEAIRRYQMAADCFRHVGEIGAWADTMMEMSQMMEQRNEFQKAYQLMLEVRTQTQAVLHERGIVL